MKKKFGYVTLFGRPNAGKSTLLNSIIKEHIAITSSKAQTTRNRINGIYNDDESQIVFLDTPGIHKPLHALGQSLNKEAYSSLQDADVVLYMVDLSDKAGKGDDFLLHVLENVECPVILVLNKVDLINKAELAEKITAWNMRREFAEIFPLSAEKGYNVEKLIETIKKYLPEGEPFYDEDSITDKSERFMVAELVREKILRLTQDEVPHSVAVTIDRMEFGRHSCSIDVTIIVEKPNQKAIIIGNQGALIKKIGTFARHDIEKLLDKKVMIEIFVKVEENWRNKNKNLKEYGYKDDNK